MDREKVINCLADIENIMIARQDICPPEELQYWVELQEGVADAISLLKDQQNVISGLKVINDGLCEAVTEQKQIVRCKDCKWAEVSDNEHTWCDHVDHEFCHNNDWFCADGERNDSNNSSSSESPNS